MHAVLMRQLKGRPPVSDLFRLNGRECLRQLELPVEGCGTVEAAVHHIEFLDQENRRGRAADRTRRCAGLSVAASP